MEQDWHAIDEKAVMDTLRTSRAGLDRGDAAERLAEYGPNQLVRAKKDSPLRMLLAQFTDVLIVILLVAVVISLLVGEVADAVLILIIVVASAVLGFAQEYRAERALEALQEMLTPTSTVTRNNMALPISTEDIVPGDILQLKEGDKVPADGRLIECFNLRITEAAITGESVPVQKTANKLPRDTLLPDRKNMVLSGTAVAYGRGIAVVTATGMKTEFGKIAHEVTTVVKERTPLEKRTNEIGKWLGAISLSVCLSVIVVGVVRDSLIHGYLRPGFLVEMVLFGVSLAVAAVPESLPAVVTGSLAIGMHRMAKSNALVRRMSAVETLGSTSVICSDKTGTITRGEMTVREIHVSGSRVAVEGEGYEPTGRLVVTEGNPSVPSGEGFGLLLTACILCNDAELALENGKWRIRGDPTEGALVVVAEKAGINVSEVRTRFPRIGEVPFSSERKRMATMHYGNDEAKLVFLKGAPEVVLERCSRIYEPNGIEKLSPESREALLDDAEAMAQRALRILALAYREGKRIDDSNEDTLENDLVFLGIVGMIDPPRADAVEAIKASKFVGITTVMITGDHALTAKAIATEAGIYEDGDLVLTDTELEQIDDSSFQQMVEKVSVYARVSPIRKLKIVQAWKKRGRIVAMTGDGVNDAPALKQADIGVAMGLTGTEVTKEAADLVLADDNFATIVKAVELGRWIYDNIKKYLAYLIQTNLVEIVMLSIAVLIGYPLPLIPPQLLYINLVTDGFPAIALGLSPPDPDIMKRPPRSPKESIFSRDVKLFYLISIAVQAPLFLFIFTSMVPVGALEDSMQLKLGRSVLFYLFVFMELVVAITCRSLRYSVFRIRPHRLLWLAVLGNAVLTIVLFSIPFVADIFELIPIGTYGIELISAMCLFTFVCIETVKYIYSKYASSRESQLLAVDSV